MSELEALNKYCMGKTLVTDASACIELQLNQLQRPPSSSLSSKTCETLDRKSRLYALCPEEEETVQDPKRFDDFLKSKLGSSADRFVGSAKTQCAAMQNAGMLPEYAGFCTAMDTKNMRGLITYCKEVKLDNLPESRTDAQRSTSRMVREFCPRLL